MFCLFPCCCVSFCAGIKSSYVMKSFFSFFFFFFLFYIFCLFCIKLCLFLILTNSQVLKRRQQEHRGLVTLPMILHVLDPCANKVKVTRAMLCQAVLYCTNSRAKEAASNGTFVDLKETGELICCCCCCCCILLQPVASFWTWKKQVNSFFVVVVVFFGYLACRYSGKFLGLKETGELICCCCYCIVWLPGSQVQWQVTEPERNRWTHLLLLLYSLATWLAGTVTSFWTWKKQVNSFVVVVVFFGYLAHRYSGKLLDLKETG